MSSLDLNKITSKNLLDQNEEKEESYSTDIVEILNPGLNDINEYNLEKKIVERYETTTDYPEGLIKKVEYVDDKGRALIVRDYHRNGRYRRTVFTPGGMKVKSEMYNRDGSLGKSAGAKKTLQKKKSVVGFYTTQELEAQMNDFLANNKRITKSDFLSFCIRYAFENLKEGDMAKHITDFQDYLSKQGY